MTRARKSPGPIADRTFEKGLKIATAGGLTAAGVLYWAGILSPSSSVHVTVTLLLFPVYLLSAALLLGVWLGYETDERNLRPASEPVDLETKSWKNWPW